jgi:Gpi18-like mannosyltransferase
MVGIYILPILYNEHLFFNNYHVYSNLPGIPLRNFVTWDAEHYIGISLYGYKGSPENMAFYPLWPALIHIFTPIFGGAAASGTILANIFSVAALVLFYKLVQSKFDRKIADISLLLLLALPGTLFLAFPYTEALFLLLSVATLNCLEKERCWRAGFWAFLAALTRPVGLFLVIVFIGAAIKCKNWKVALAGIGPLLGYGAVLLILYLQTGNAFGQLSAIKGYSNGTSASNLYNLPAFFSALITVDAGHSYGHSPIDRMFFIWLLGSLPSIYKRDKTWFAYAIATGILPAMATEFISYSRYFLMGFPVVVCAAIYFNEAKRTPALYITLASLMILQVFFLVMHFNYYWAG